MNTQKLVLIFFTVAIFLFVNTGFSQNTKEKKIENEKINLNLSSQDISFDNYEAKIMDLYINKNNDSYSAFNCIRECANCKHTACPMYKIAHPSSENQIKREPFNLEKKLSYNETQGELQLALMNFN